MSVRNCAEIGPILQEVISRLLANDELCRLIYFTDRNPIEEPKYIQELERNEYLEEVLGRQLKISKNLEETVQEYCDRVKVEWSRIKKKEIYEKLIKVVPRVGPKEFDNSVVVVRVARGSKNPNNNQFRDLSIYIESFVPLTQWLVNDENLRPFLIMGEIQKSLDGKRMNQIGKMIGGDFELQVLTEEVSCYEQEFAITTYE